MLHKTRGVDHAYQISGLPVYIIKGHSTGPLVKHASQMSAVIYHLKCRQDVRDSQV